MRIRSSKRIKNQFRCTKLSFQVKPRKRKLGFFRRRLEILRGPKLCHWKFMAKVLKLPLEGDETTKIVSPCCSSSSTSFWCRVPFCCPPARLTKFSMNSKLWLCFTLCHYKMVVKMELTCVNTQMREEWKSDKVTTF